MTITVLYDGKCGLCSKEIEHYKKIAPPERFNWTDVTTDTAPLKDLQLSLSDALLYLRALDDHGTLHTGVDAFILIWKNLSNWRWLAWLIALPGIHYLAKVIYKRFAHWRFSRLEHCKL